MKTYIVTVHDEDEDYTEGVLRAIADSGRQPIEISESRPLPKRKRKRAVSQAVLAGLLLLLAVGCDNIPIFRADADGPEKCCPTVAAFGLPAGTFHDCGFARPEAGLSCPPAGVAGCLAGTCIQAVGLVPCCCPGSGGAWCDPAALAAGCVERPAGFGGTCEDLL